MTDGWLTRRHVLVGGGAASCLGVGAFLASHAGAAADAGTSRFRIETTTEGRTVRRVHDGKGAIGVKFFFEPERPGRPALFLHYDLPPGTSEGVHVHDVGQPAGPWDEYYYIVAGSGVMRIDGRDVPVTAGDHVHTPLGVAHGIENTSEREPLKVFLTAIARATGEASSMP